MALTQVTRTYLEMTSPEELRAVARPEPPPRIEEVRECPVSFFRYLYAEVGRAFHWTERLAWSDERVREHLASPDVSLWLMTWLAAPAGYFELKRYDDDSVEVAYRSWRITTRGGLSGMPETIPRLPHLQGLDETERVLALVDVFASAVEVDGDTTNVTVVDRNGNACVVTSSLGLGSGDFLPGRDLHLNSMLGEADLLRGELVPGSRMQSMMAPLLAFDEQGLALAGGAAGGTRLRTALLGVVASILDEDLSAAAAVERPRFHPAPSVVHAEPGVDAAALDELEACGRTVRRWPAPHHYFGGVSVVSRAGAAADPRRSGAATVFR